MKKNLKKTSVGLASLGLVTVIALSGGLQVSANENPTQNNVAKNQDSARLYAEAYKKITASEALADKDVKAAIDRVYAQFPKTKSYAITSANVIDNFVSNFSRYNITFREKDSKRSITFGINVKTGEIITPEKKEV
ncbi:hypothetical protein [Brevibacillus laterosporus]|uniref:PepSY domain-containing protein n=1 Tax=Brevibacillus laterosporus TaxID=1465 RepID=A0A0F6Y018_BRELA|nr:hypothetical protein EX87_14795 [Brevibacillus laterosporus]